MTTQTSPNKKDMKVKELIELMSFISSSDLNEVKIETDEMKISVRKSVEIETRYVEHHTSSAISSAPVQTAAPVAVAPTIASLATLAAPAEDKYITVKSPMIGTFYRSANPESPSFVELGTKISVGSKVCIIEAMKLFNEIESEISGTIVKVLVENSSPVEFDQPLFLVDPS